MMTSSPRFGALVVLPLALCALACQPEDVPDPAMPAPEARAPLKPLIYTEVPNLTPEAAAVRERRLMRELIHGASDGTSWGRLKRRDAYEAPRDAQALGEMLTQALLTRDEARWDHAFVSPTSYAQMVHVEQEEAKKFVDELQGASHKLWQRFDVRLASEAPRGGLGSVFVFKGLDLGEGRMVSGKIAEEDEPVAQHWGNVLSLGVVGTDVIFEVRISKILRVVDRERLPSGEPLLAVASEVEAPHRLDVFLEAGLHLKPELLRSKEYPYPLSVGNFWRYRRFVEGARAEPRDEMSAALEGGPSNTSRADEVLLEVTHVERYGTLRLVRHRRSYNDSELTTRERHWLLSPRSVYACSRGCVRHIDDLGWVLAYMQRHTPLFHFPLVRGEGWGAWGQEVPREQAEVRVRSRARDVEVPAGMFIAAEVLDAQDGGLLEDPLISAARSAVTFAQGHGVIKRRIEGTDRRGDEVTIIEELVESRIMP